MFTSLRWLLELNRQSRRLYGNGKHIRIDDLDHRFESEGTRRGRIRNYHRGQDALRCKTILPLFPGGFRGRHRVIFITGDISFEDMDHLTRLFVKTYEVESPELRDLVASLCALTI